MHAVGAKVDGLRREKFANGIDRGRDGLKSLPTAPACKLVNVAVVAAQRRRRVGTTCAPIGLLMIFDEYFCAAHVFVSPGPGEALHYGRVLRHHQTVLAPAHLDLSRPDLECRLASKAQAVGCVVSPSPLGIFRASAGIPGSAARKACRDGRAAIGVNFSTW